MGCDCIQKIKDRVNLEKDAIHATVGSNDSQRSEVVYRPIRLDGEPSKHNRYTSAKWEYCPFCGVKI